MDWLKNLRRIRCPHKISDGLRPHSLKMGEYDVLEHDPAGVTIGWGGEFAVLMRSKCHCKLCGEDFETSGIAWRDRFKRDKDGWPLNADGSRMEMAEQ